MSKPAKSEEKSKPGGGPAGVSILSILRGAAASTQETPTTFAERYREEASGGKDEARESEGKLQKMLKKTIHR